MPRQSTGERGSPLQPEKKTETMSRASFIEAFLRFATIDEVDIPLYSEFLNSWGLKETTVRLLTKDELKEYQIEYKTNPKNSEFNLVRADAALIAEAATKWVNRSGATKRKVNDKEIRWICRRQLGNSNSSFWCMGCFSGKSCRLKTNKTAKFWNKLRAYAKEKYGASWVQFAPTTKEKVVKLSILKEQQKLVSTTVRANFLMDPLIVPLMTSKEEEEGKNGEENEQEVENEDVEKEGENEVEDEDEDDKQTDDEELSNIQVVKKLKKSQEEEELVQVTPVIISPNDQEKSIPQRA